GTALRSITTSIATGCPILATPKLRPPVSASASGLPVRTDVSPTITTSDSATPGAAVATTTALPGLRPVTSPVLETVATPGVPLVQVASEGDSCFPAISVTTAASCAVFPGLRVVRVTYPGLTSTLAGAVSGATVSRSVSAAARIATPTLPAYTPAPSRDRIPSTSIRYVLTDPTTTTGTVIVAFPASSTGTVVSATTTGARVCEDERTTTRRTSRSSRSTIPPPSPTMPNTGTIESFGPPSPGPPAAHSAHPNTPPATTSASQARRITAPIRAPLPPAARRAIPRPRCSRAGRTPPDPGPPSSPLRRRGSAGPRPGAPAIPAARGLRPWRGRARYETRCWGRAAAPETAAARAARPARARCRAAPGPPSNRSRAGGSDSGRRRT